MAQNDNDVAVTGRYGYVSDYDPQKHMARVKFPDLDDLVSGWLPVGVRNSKDNRDECALDIDEHVFCLLLGNGTEEGIVLCSLYDESNLPLNQDKQTRYVKFKDETEMYYNREENELMIKNKTGSYITMKEGEIKIFGVDLVHAENKAGSYLDLSGGEVKLHGASHVGITAPRIDLN